MWFQGEGSNSKWNNPEPAKGIPSPFRDDHDDMKMLRDSIIDLLSSKQRHPLSMEAKEHIEARLHQLFPLILQTPEHPPYSEMIYKAIEALMDEKEGSGSSKASISAYIRSHYHGQLPWAHESFLSRHLDKLVQKGEIFSAPNGFYMFPKHSIREQELGNEEQEFKKILSHSVGDDDKDCDELEILQIKPLITVREETETCPCPTEVQARRRRGRPPNKLKQQGIEKGMGMGMKKRRKKREKNVKNKPKRRGRRGRDSQLG